MCVPLPLKIAFITVFLCRNEFSSKHNQKWFNYTSEGVVGWSLCKGTLQWYPNSYTGVSIDKNAFCFYYIYSSLMLEILIRGIQFMWYDCDYFIVCQWFFLYGYSFQCFTRKWVWECKVFCAMIMNKHKRKMSIFK